MLVSILKMLMYKYTHKILENYKSTKSLPTRSPTYFTLKNNE